MNENEYVIYCDESCHLEHDGIKPMLIGAVWCPKSKRTVVFNELRHLKEKHGIPSHCELKWNAVSPSKQDYYLDVIRYFFDNPDLHYRVVIIPDKSILKHESCHQTHDDFYYKMYFRLLKTIIDPKCSYEIYIDIKDTKSQCKVQKLHDVLCNSNYDFDHSIILKIQQVRSHEVELIQLADLLTGALAYFQRGLTQNIAKVAVINLIREMSGYSLQKSTLYKEDKINIFIWKGGTENYV